MATASPAIQGPQRGRVLRVDLDYRTDDLGPIIRGKRGRQVFVVQAQDDSVYFGTLANTLGPPDSIEIADAGKTTITIAQSRVVRLA